MLMKHRVTGVVLDVPDGDVEDYTGLGYQAEDKPKPRRRKQADEGD